MSINKYSKADDWMMTMNRAYASLVVEFGILILLQASDFIWIPNN